MATSIHPARGRGAATPATMSVVNDAPPTPDDALARRAAGGDVTAFAVLYARHAARVYLLCLRMTGSAPEAEDLTHDAFVRAFRGAGDFRGGSAFAAWLRGLALDQVLTRLRNGGVRTGQAAGRGDTPKQSVGDTAGRGRAAVIDGPALERAVALLPLGYRTVFVLHDMEGCGHEEIAEMLGCPVGESRSQLHRARMMLRGLLRRQTTTTRPGARGPNTAGGEG